MKTFFVFLALSISGYAQASSRFDELLGVIAGRVKDGFYDAAPVVAALDDMKTQNLLSPDDIKEVTRDAFNSRAKSFQHKDGKITLSEDEPWVLWPKPKKTSKIRTFNVSNLNDIYNRMSEDEKVISVVATSFDEGGREPRYGRYAAKTHAVGFTVVVETH